MQVVTDTNVLPPMIAPGAELAPIYEAVLDERLDWLVSTEIFFEYLEKLGERSAPETAARLRQVFQFSASVVVIEPAFRFRLVVGDSTAGPLHPIVS